MKKWNKWLALGTAAVMSMTMLAGCGSSSTETTAPAEATPVSTETTEGTTTSAAETTAAETTEYPADVQAIIDRGVLNVGVKNAVIGFGYQDTLTGEYSGLEISLAEKLAEYLGVDVEFTAVTAATRTELLDSGDIDCVLATFTITDERKKSWDFTTPYFTDHVSVLVENSSGIKTLSDLVDKKVGVSFAQYEDYPTISTALSAGEVDAFCVDKSILAIYNTDSRSYIEEQFAPQEYGIATTKGSGLSTVCEDLVQQWLSDGTIDGLITENGLD